jgi:hypothetical protein
MSLLHLILLLILFILAKKYWNARKCRLIFKQELAMLQAITEIEKIAIKGVELNIFLNALSAYQGLYYIILNREYQIHFKDIFKSNEEDYLEKINDLKKCCNTIDKDAGRHVDAYLSAFCKALVYKNPIKISIIFIKVFADLLTKKTKLKNVSSEINSIKVSSTHSFNNSLDNYHKQKPAWS